MRLSVFLLFVICSFQVLHAEEVIMFVELESDTYSEPTSIDSFLHDFNGSIRDGEFAYTRNRIEMGARYKYLSISLISRYDYFVEFNNELARAYHSAVNDLLPEEGKKIDVYMKASHFRSNGIKLGGFWQLAEGVSFRASLSTLYANQMVDGRANGYAGYLDENDYFGEIHFNLYSHEDLLLEMSVPSPKGHGYAIDFGIDWQINSQWYLSLDIEDAYSKIRWKDVLYSDLVATTATVQFDSEGRLHTRAVISGEQHIVNMTQRLPVKYQGQLNFRINEAHGVYVDALHVSSYLTMPTLGYSYSLSEMQQLHWEFNTRSKAIGVQYRNEYFSVGLATDSLNGRKAHQWQLMLSYSQPIVL